MTNLLDIFRPRYHFTPPQNWMNDPNGLVYLDGEYHLFYQYNPYARYWGHMSWGHAVSQNLVHWEHLPLAIWEVPAEGYTIFSGSAVVDREDTAGFGKSAMVAVYTADYAEPEKLQDIHIAYSIDKGRTFQQYENNPVIATGEAKFGDPKVFWYPQDQKWVMLNICHLPQGHVELYSSSNLREWGYKSSFFAEQDAPGIWECPDLFPLAVDANPENVKWVMKVNCTRFGEGPAATRYFVGDFDGQAFHNAQLIGCGLTSDDGAIYAEVTYNDEPRDRRILTGWLREAEHEGRAWTGAMAIPRELSLKTIGDKLVLCQYPVTEMTSLRRDAIHISDQVLENGFDINANLHHRAVEVHMAMLVKNTQRAGLKLTLSSGKEAIIGYDALLRKLFYIFEDKVITAPFSPVQVSDEYADLTLIMYLDQAHVEVFGDSSAALTCALPFGAEYKTLTVFSDHGPAVVHHLDVWNLS